MSPLSRDFTSEGWLLRLDSNQQPQRASRFVSLRIASDELGLPYGRLYAAAKNGDRDPWLLGVHNGVIDLSTGQLRPGTADDRVTMCTASAFDPNALCPLWEQTIADIFNHDAALIGYLQRAFGYSLSGDCREECLFLCWGDGRNGKGTLVNTLAWLLGDYADNLSFSALELHERGSSTSTNDVAKLVGRYQA